MAEGGGLLNRYRLVKAYRGFESLRLRQSFPISCWDFLIICERKSARPYHEPQQSLSHQTRDIVSLICVKSFTAAVGNPACARRLRPPPRALTGLRSTKFEFG